MNGPDILCGGGEFGTSNGPAALFGLIPSKVIDPATGAPYDKIAPVCIGQYLCYQQASGTGITLLVFDRATFPGDGTLLDDAAGFKFAVKLAAAPDGWNSGVCFHRFDHGLVIVASTSSVQVTAANENTLFSVVYYAYRSG